MKFLRFTKKKAIVAATVVGVMLVATAAFAYFTNAGSGSGTATVGTSSAIELSSSNVGTLYPGGPDVSVAVSVHNPSAGNQYVATISGAVADNGGCLGAWFVVDPITYNQNVLAGATVTPSTKIRMLESGTNQDACKSKVMTVNWTSN